MQTAIPHRDRCGSSPGSTPGEFARAGRGVAPVLSVLVRQLRKESGLSQLGPARKVRGELYAISMERNVKHPAVLAICTQAASVFAQKP